MPLFDNYDYNSTTTWNYGWSLNNTPYLSQQFVFMEPLEVSWLWTNARERDRWNLARTRGYSTPLLSTPTIKAVACLLSTPRRARPARSRFERNHLNKRALAKR